jgi:serine/threonine protein kinase
VKPTRDELELYVIGAYDGDVAALEAHLTADAEARAVVADEAAFESLLRDAAAAATFCPGCDDIVRGERCDQCGTAVHPGGYIVERVLVTNAHGRMYVAHDVDGRQVALKELAFVQSPGSDAVAAFEREARFLRALEHPNIPRFCAAFEEGSGVHTRYYLAQDLVTGQALDARLADHFYTEAEIVDVARQVLGVLVYLQSVSPMVFHRDIKPANLIRRTDGTIAVVDFGAAHVQGTTIGSTTIGTFGYMPIEQMAGQVDTTTDVYALGATLLHLLTRSEPWRLLQGAALGPINVSAPMRAYLKKLTAPEPKDRYPDAAAALAALERVAKGEDVMPVVATTETKPQRWYVRRPMLALGIAVVVSAAAGHAGYRASEIAHRRDRENRLNDRSLLPGRPAPEARAEAEANASRRPKSAPPATVPPGQPIDLDLKGTSLADALRMVSSACKLNIVLPDDVQATFSDRLSSVPCDQVFEVLLEAHGLWYEYSPDANLVRVAPRRQLDLEHEEAVQRAQQGIVEPRLPAGDNVDIDMKDVPLRDLIRMLADAGKVNIVVPDDIAGAVTVRVKHVPWNLALESVLASKGLWYRYRENGRLVRIAPRRQLDLEDDAARQR